MYFVLNFLNFKIKYKVSNKSINESTIANLIGPLRLSKLLVIAETKFILILA